MTVKGDRRRTKTAVKGRGRGRGRGRGKGRGGGRGRGKEAVKDKNTVKAIVNQDVNIFHDTNWCKFAVCEVLEEDGEWRRCTLYNLKSSESVVCVFFGDNEYEGLPPHSYSVNRNTNVLRDSDGDEVTTRRLIYCV